MTARQRTLAIRAHAKLRRLVPCSDGCPGWAIFETSHGMDIESCDECWSGVPDGLLDEEAAAMPEAQTLLTKEAKHQGIPIRRGDTYTSWS